MRRFCTLAATALVLTLGAANASAMTPLEKNELSDSVGGLFAAQKLCSLRYESVAMQDFVKKNAPADDLTFMQRAQAHSSYLEQQAGKWPTLLRDVFCRDNAKVARQYGL